MKKIATLLVLCLMSLPCSALDVVGYKELKRLSADTRNAKGDYANTLLKGYLSGLSDTYSQLSFDGHISVRYRHIPLEVCLPPGVKLSPELIRTALDLELENHADDYSGDLRSQQYAVSMYAGFGLARMFPCKAVSPNNSFKPKPLRDSA